MSLKFKNRIALHYMLATAIIIATAFAGVYVIVERTVMNNLDNDLAFEAHKHTKEVTVFGDSIKFTNKAEWAESEHREVQVNPVFIQLTDKKGRLMDKSPNLKEAFLSYNHSEHNNHFDSYIGNRSIRQVQVPINQQGELKGYILAAMSSESAHSTLLKLRNVLIISYLFILFGLFFISRFLAGRSIKPIRTVTHTISRITKHNLKERVPLPPNKDEIYELSTNFNSLLDRIEHTLEREKQFTSDASHELRTPLASLRGTLEVLIRKKRSIEEYEEKIKFSLAEIEKMADTLEQLLLLARLDSSHDESRNSTISLITVVNDSLTRLNKSIVEKNIEVKLTFDKNQELLVPQYYTQLIIENVLSNAIKYSTENSAIEINLTAIDNHVICEIRDYGIGIEKEDLKHIFNSFFRSNALQHKHITGNGLGLSIAKKCADAIGTKLKLESEPGQGTTVSITF